MLRHLSGGRSSVRVQIAFQLIIMSILTLITVAAFTHIATMLIFRRLVVGKRKPPRLDDHLQVHSEEFFVPVTSSLNRFDDDTTTLSVIGRALDLGRRFAISSRTAVQRGLVGSDAVSGEIFVRRYHFTGPGGVPSKNSHLILCNPSGETVDTVATKAVPLARDIGYDTLTVFDYRPTGRSCKGIVVPDTVTMLEDAESVLQWLMNVMDIPIEQISIAGISLGGIQAIRLAMRNPNVPKLLLINTFSSFYCMLGNAAPLLFPVPFRLGRTGDFLPNLNAEITKNLNTPKVVVVSVENDERIPTRCTDEMISAIQKSVHDKNILHVRITGTHSAPQIDHTGLETIREFLEHSL